MVCLSDIIKNTIMYNIRKGLLVLVPSCIVSEISCFALYDNHPRDEKTLDITICTKNKEIIEFYKRDIVNSSTLATNSNPSQIKLLRNSKCELLYFVLAEDEVLILKKDLSVYKKIDSVESYDWSDPLCTGQATIRVFRKDDAVPIKFDADFSIVEELDFNKTSPEDDGIPVIMQLKQKLSEAKYSVSCNEKVLHEFMNLRHLSTFSINKKPYSIVKDSVAVEDLKSGEPWVRIYDGRIALVLEVYNSSMREASNVHIVLQSSIGSLKYTTLYTSSDQLYLPTNNTVAPGGRIYIATVISIEDLHPSSVSRVDLNPGLVFCMGDKRHVHIQPIQTVGISAGNLVGGLFHVTKDMIMADTRSRLAMMLISRRTQLSVRTAEDRVLDLEESLCEHLNMKKTGGVLVCEGALGGLAVDVTEKGQGVWVVTVYSRNEHQLLWLVHAVYDQVPLRLLLTVPSWGVVPHANTELQIRDNHHSDYSEYASCMVREMALIREHLDACMVSMHRANHPNAGLEVDLLAAGDNAYQNLRKTLCEEGARGIASVMREGRRERDDAMVVESVEY